MTIPRVGIVLLIALGVLARFNHFTQPWGTKDHYSRGGPPASALTLCLRTVPLDQSKGLVHLQCPAQKSLEHNPNFSRLSSEEQTRAKELDTQKGVWNSPVLEPNQNHPPTMFYGLWGMIKIFGDSEWVYRLYIILFSLANVGLVYVLGRKIWQDERALYAAAFQSLFLGSIYFSSHVDYPNEYNATFLLLAAIAALDRKWTWAFLAALIGGLWDWPGFFAMVPIAILAWKQDRAYGRIALAFVVSVLAFLGVAMWLRQTGNPLDFFLSKLKSSGHVTEPLGWGERLAWGLSFVRTIGVSYSRLLGPAFMALAAWQLVFGKEPGFSRYRQALLLLGLPGLITIIVGREWVVVHIFWLVYTLPFFAILCGQSMGRLLQSQLVVSKAWRWVLVLIPLALYPYGIFQGHRIHDVINSVGIILTTFALAFWGFQKSPIMIWGLVFSMGFWNASQVWNYRTEMTDQSEICFQAMREHIRTGQTVQLPGTDTDAKRWTYCRGVPVEYSGSQEQ